MADQKNPNSQKPPLLEQIANLKKQITNLKEQIPALKKQVLTHKQARHALGQRNRDHQAAFDRMTDSLATERPIPPKEQPSFDGISFVIAYYDIPQQIERTLESCSPAYQGCTADEIEVIIVDNGSTEPLPDDLMERFPHVRQILRTEGQPSPVFALNTGIKAARHEMIAVMIDGAHMLSPGVVQHVRELRAMYSNPVINVPQYILGMVSQNLHTSPNVFDEETANLTQVGWPEDGYALFNYAVYPGENVSRTYLDAYESNCLITTRKVLDDLGGFDERYEEPGGGFANLEIFSRLIHAPQNTYITLAGEGSFHQNHGGTTTQLAPEERTKVVDSYKARHLEVTGSEAVVNTRSPVLYGKVRRGSQKIPTISKEFGKASNRILTQLANIYVGRARAGMTGNYNPVLSVGGSPDERLARTPLPPLGLLSKTAARNGVEKKELNYLHCLRQVHAVVRPKFYFEIGVDTGSSLALARCPAVGVDPAFVVTKALKAPCRLFREKSDDFFSNTTRCQNLLGRGIDLAFIDGMHLAEFILRDFIKTERWMSKDGVILIDDILPEQMEMLERERRFEAWCGDVYKIVPILRRYRPDLKVSVFETFIGPYRKGLVVVTGLDPNNSSLEAQYKQIAAEISDGTFDVSSIAQLDTVIDAQPIKDLAATASQHRAAAKTA